MKDEIFLQLDLTGDRGIVYVLLDEISSVAQTPTGSVIRMKRCSDFHNVTMAPELVVENMIRAWKIIYDA